ncbi:hypothetical protein CS063_11360 [Sporanaerobium hydrogeniformans]|uniref:Uncharacterized protein n=1 Tax=Sporanaerobium hydrogeniformans TaxID=3072179 RepID=A0AC61DAI1_9FIRM|nr:DUF2975 domain-containing protein [Sporanaerobium hydrogeniformans]PHV70259.1 hypothetical protein CS063_11360 [Sporanaerobium hydrogeniformans]
MRKLKTDGLSKLLFALVMIGLILMSVALVTLPWLMDLLFRGSTFYEVVSHKKVLLLLYMTGIPAWLILWMTKNLTHNIINREPFSESSCRSLKGISLCALMIFVCYLFASIFVYATLGIVVITIGSFVVALIAAILYRLVGLAIEIKEENELTI